VHFVIAYGGNNTTTEVFAAGKPMLVLPLFANQPDNAQRLHETGYSARLDPYTLTEEQLIGTIDSLLYNGELSNKLRRAAKRIQAANRHEALACKIEIGLQRQWSLAWCLQTAKQKDCGGVRNVRKLHIINCAIYSNCKYINVAQSQNVFSP